MKFETEEKKTFSEGTDQTSGGSSSENKDAGQGNDPVSYETHRRILSQRKKDQEKIKEFEERFAEIDRVNKTAEEQKLAEQGEFKKIVELRDKKIDELSNKLQSVVEEKTNVEKTVKDTHKLQAFYEKLPGKIAKKEYLSFVDLEKIAYDPETGVIDNQSVDLVVNDFMENHSKLIEAPKGHKLPNGYPSGTNKLTLEQWQKLPLKEMKAQMKNVIK